MAIIMKVSVVVLTYNSEKTIRRCLDSLLHQTYREFELIIVDDGSSDTTRKILSSYKDSRIKIHYNQKNSGIAKSRNIGWKESTGDYVFFTDSDCTPMSTWLEEGIRTLQGGCSFVTGLTFYENARTSLRHKIVQGKDAFYTCNLGFKRTALESIHGFDERLKMWAEDKDICYRILKKGGEKEFNEKMMVIHLETVKTPRGELKNYRNFYHGKLLCQVRYGKENGIVFRIMRPDHLLVMLFPPLLLVIERITSLEDVKIIPFTWLGMVIGRISMWKLCLKLQKLYI